MSGSVESSQLVERQVRNRIIEWLEMVVGYPSDTPPWDLNETLNQWEDWNPWPVRAESYPAPVYTEQEASALVSVGKALERFADVTPAKLRDDNWEMARPEWSELVNAVRLALQVLVHRGHL